MTLVDLAALRRTAILLAASAGLSLLAGCGGGGGYGGGGGASAPAAPNPPAGGGAPASSVATITISGNKVSPEVTNVALGATITFVNQDSRAHEMMSDPHPLHNDCPEINVGMLNPGQSKQTAALMVARACGFHDNMQDTNTSLRGRILVAGVEDPGTRY
jgi:plastocyanin